MRYLIHYHATIELTLLLIVVAQWIWIKAIRGVLNSVRDERDRYRRNANGGQKF